MTDNNENREAVTVAAPNSDPFTGRIRSVIGDESVRNFAKRAGIPPSSLQHVLEGGKPNVEKLVAIADAGGVSVDWLATGRGEAAAGGFAEDQAAYSDQADSEFVGVPRYAVRLSAGAGAVEGRIRVIDHIPFTERFLRRKLGRSNADGLAIVEVAGDSMEPTIGNGDLVMIDMNDCDVVDGLFALVIEDTLVVKRVRRLAEGLEIYSDNHALYPPLRFGRADLEHLHVIGRVRWIASLV